MSDVRVIKISADEAEALLVVSDILTGAASITDIPENAMTLLAGSILVNVVADRYLNDSVDPLEVAAVLEYALEKEKN